MARKHHTLALITLLAAAPTLVSAAEPAGSPDRPTSSAPGTPGTAPAATSTDLPAPATPFPMNLPDDATQPEVKGQYGIGMAGLIFGTVLVAAVVLGVLFFVTRRSWSAGAPDSRVVR